MTICYDQTNYIRTDNEQNRHFCSNNEQTKPNNCTNRQTNEQTNRQKFLDWNFMYQKQIVMRDDRPTEEDQILYEKINWH